MYRLQRQYMLRQLQSTQHQVAVPVGMTHLHPASLVHGMMTVLALAGEVHPAVAQAGTVTLAVLVLAGQIALAQTALAVTGNLITK